MGRLGVIVAAAILIGAGIILFAQRNWEAGLLCILIGIALGIFFFRG